MLILLLKIGACLELFATYCVAMYSFCKPSIISYVEKIYKNSHTISIVFLKFCFTTRSREKSKPFRNFKFDESSISNVGA